jgi:hypothetical protein
MAEAHIHCNHHEARTRAQVAIPTITDKQPIHKTTTCNQFTFTKAKHPSPTRDHDHSITVLCHELPSPPSSTDHLSVPQSNDQSIITHHQSTSQQASSSPIARAQPKSAISPLSILITTVIIQSLIQQAAAQLCTVQHRKLLQNRHRRTSTQDPKPTASLLNPPHHYPRADNVAASSLYGRQRAKLQQRK